MVRSKKVLPVFDFKREGKVILCNAEDGESDCSGFVSQCLVSSKCKAMPDLFQICHQLFLQPGHNNYKKKKYIQQLWISTIFLVY